MKEIAAHLDVTVRTAEGWALLDNLPIVVLRNFIKADPAELDRWMKANTFTYGEYRARRLGRRFQTKSKPRRAGQPVGSTAPSAFAR